MSCAIWRELLSARLDVPLDPEQGRALDAHVALCRDCATHARELAVLGALLRSEPAPEPPAELVDEIFASLARRRPSWLRRLAGSALGALPQARLAPSLSAALLLLAVVLIQTPLPERAAATDVREPGAVTAPVAARSQAGILTVWDSSADTIVASADPAGLAGWNAVQEAPSRRRPAGVRPHPQPPEVRIFLFERIVVNE